MVFSRRTFFVHLLGLIASTVLFSCKEDPELPSAELPRTEMTEVIEDKPVQPITETIHGQGYLDSIPIVYDTTFLIDGVKHTLHIVLQLNGKDTVWHSEGPYEYENKRYIDRYWGRDVIYRFQLKDANGKTVWNKRFTKKDFTKTLGGIVAQSNMHLPQFKTYLTSTQQLILTQHFWRPESDIGIQGILYFDLKGNAEINYHCLYGSAGSDCDVYYSPDSSFLMTCTEIITRTGKKVPIQQDHSLVAGNMFIGDRHAFVSYVFDKDTSAFGGRLYDWNGNLLKEIDFAGYEQILSYNLPHLFYEKLRRYYFVDESNKCIWMIPEKNPSAIESYPFSRIRYKPSKFALDTLLILSNEVNKHRFGIDASGNVRTHQVGDYREEWQFFDEMK